MSDAASDPVTAAIRQRALIARIVAKAGLAGGFIAGIYGLDQPESLWLPSALGLLITGILAQAYAFYAGLTRGWSEHEKRKDSM
ncbi:MAG: hypothetical protein ACREI3_04020 [Nitrospirales bacterium]